MTKADLVTSVFRQVLRSSMFLYACGTLLMLMIAPAALAAETAPPQAEPAATDPSMMIDLATALRLAHQQGRERVERDESLELVRLRLQTVRGTYLPRWDSALQGGIAGGEQQEDTLTVSGDISVRQSLPTAGEVALSLRANQNSALNGGDDSAGLRAELSLSQPLWRGAGTLRWRESLTDAERAWLYAQRSHSLFLQDLSLRVAREFWRLQQQVFTVESTRQAKLRAEFVLRQAKAFREIGKADMNGVLRAEINMLRSRQNLIDAQAGLAIRLDRFKIQLGLSPKIEITISPNRASLLSREVDPQLAIATALAQRLDLMTARDRVADAKRATTFARQDLRPQFDLSAAVGVNSEADHLAADWDDPQTDYRASVRLTLPLDRRQERLALQQSMVSLANAQRNAAAVEDNILIEVQEALRNLRSAAASVLIQQASRDQAIKRLLRSRIDYEAGQISNRDLLEAQTELQDAEIALFRTHIDALDAELRLRRETGTLAITADGSWLDTALPYHRSSADAAAGNQPSESNQSSDDEQPSQKPQPGAEEQPR